MDRQERANFFEMAVKAAMAGLRADIWTALPAEVVDYDATKQTVSAQPTPQPQVKNQQGVWSNVTLPVCLDCPVDWPGGGGMGLYFPLKAGDEGILIFASRCISAWYTQGGVQPQEEFRMHNLSDGMFIPRLRSKPNVPTGLSTTTTQLRTDDGVTMLELDPIGQRINILAVGGLWVNGVRVTVP